MKPRGVAVMADLNITPLIDILLVLLIVFMAVVPAVRRQLDTDLPAPAAHRGPPPKAPLIRVDAKGLALDAQPVASLGDLEARLRERLAGSDSRRVLVEAAGALPYREVVRVLDTARSAGAEQLAMLPASGPLPN